MSVELYAIFSHEIRLEIIEDLPMFWLAQNRNCFFYIRHFQTQHKYSTQFIRILPSIHLHGCSQSVISPYYFYETIYQPPVTYPLAWAIILAWSVERFMTWLNCRWQWDVFLRFLLRFGPFRIFISEISLNSQPQFVSICCASFLIECFFSLMCALKCGCRQTPTVCCFSNFLCLFSPYLVPIDFVFTHLVSEYLPSGWS